MLYFSLDVKKTPLVKQEQLYFPILKNVNYILQCLELKQNFSMERNFTFEFQNLSLHDNSGDECLRHQKHFEGNKNNAIAICVVNIPLCLTTLFANTVVLITIWKTPSLHTPSYLLQASLAVSDFAVGLAVQPLLISLLLTAIYGVPPPIFHFICLSYTAMAYTLCGVSLYSITAIGLDRFLALRLHLHYISCKVGYNWYLVASRRFCVKFIMAKWNLFQSHCNITLCFNTCKLFDLFENLSHCSASSSTNSASISRSECWKRS